MTYLLTNFTIGLLPFLLAQDYPSTRSTDVDTGSSIAGVIFGLIAYLIGSFLIYKILQKCNVENPWFAWIPILNIYAIFQAGDEENPTLWTILSLVPCINIVAAVKQVLAWIKISQKLGKSPWLLLLALIPLGAFVLLGMLAYT